MYFCCFLLSFDFFFKTFFLVFGPPLPAVEIADDDAPSSDSATEETPASLADDMAENSEKRWQSNRGFAKAQTASYNTDFNTLQAALALTTSQL
jgi:hypothetical protein